jgi:hypothetical protein
LIEPTFSLWPLLEQVRPWPAQVSVQLSPPSPITHRLAENGILPQRAVATTPLASSTADFTAVQVFHCDLIPRQTPGLPDGAEHVHPVMVMPVGHCAFDFAPLSFPEADPATLSQSDEPGIFMQRAYARTPTPDASTFLVSERYATHSFSANLEPLQV